VATGKGQFGDGLQGSSQVWQEEWAEVRRVEERGEADDSRCSISGEVDDAEPQRGRVAEEGVGGSAKM
jgi:hypothetical protein